MSQSALLELDQVTVAFPGPGGAWRPAIEQVSLTVARRQRIGIVGESGSGKSLTALAALGLVPEPGEIRSGSVRVDHSESSNRSADTRNIRGGVIGLVLQEPGSALNPVLAIGTQLVETIRCHRRMSHRNARHEAMQLLGRVSLDQPGELLAAYPHQLSGGQLQRVMLALALAGEPELIVADEPTTALDVTTQAQVLGLLRRVCEEERLSLLLISHDLAVVAAAVDRVEVMYAGEIVESGPMIDLFRSPRHPYTQMLLAAAPRHLNKFEPAPTPKLEAGPLQRSDTAIVDDRSAPGCRFARRCPLRVPDCETEHPDLVATGDRRLRCPLVGDDTGSGAELAHA
jgi:oligopeptide/dipeptide ABC transporter ATP-binding protein